MTLRIAELPDESSERAAWIERELVGGDLRAFVAELVALGADRGSGEALAEPVAPGTALAGKPPVAPGSLDAALAGKLTSVLESGLGVPSPRTISSTFVGVLSAAGAGMAAASARREAIASRE